MSSDDVKITAAPSKRPTQRRMRDMALSMAVLVVPLLVIFGVWNWLASDRAVSVIDPGESYANAEALGLDVIEPELAEDWKPVSSAVASKASSVTLRVGWHSPEGNGFQVVQTNGAPVDVNDELTGDGDGTVEVGGVTWTVYDTADGTSWAGEVAGSTVVLAADENGAGELPELAAGVTAA